MSNVAGPTIVTGVIGGRLAPWLRRLDGSGWRALLVRLGLCLFLGGLLSLHAGADNNWDLLNYHLYDPFAFLGHRFHRDLNAVGLQTTFNPLLDVPYYELATQWLPTHPWLVTFLAGFPYGMLGFGVFELARLMPGGQTGGSALLALLIGVSGTTVVSEIGGTEGDVPVAVLLVAALWPVMWALARPAGERRWLSACLASGIAAGLAGGAKLTACAFAPGLAVAAFAVGRSWRSRALGAAVFCLFWWVGFAVTGGWWAAHLWEAFGDPVFPMFGSLFHTPWTVAGVGRDTRFLPRSVVQALFYPFWWLTGKPMIASETGVRDWHFAVAYVAVMALAAAAGLARLRRRRAIDDRILLLALFFAIGFATWEAMFSVLRYAIPLEALTGLVVVAALHELLPPRRVGQVALGVLIFLLATSGWPGWGRASADHGRLFRIGAPPLPAGSVVAVVSKPIGFVLPSLQGKDIAFVGVAELAAGTRLREAVAHRLDRARRVFALEQTQNTGDVATLAALGWTVVPGSCVPVHTVRERGIRLCATRRDRTLSGGKAQTTP